MAPDHLWNLLIRIVGGLCASGQQTVRDAEIAATLTLDWLLFENDRMLLRKEWGRAAPSRCSREDRAIARIKVIVMGTICGQDRVHLALEGTGSRFAVWP